MNTATSLRRRLLASLLAFTAGCASAGGGSGASSGGDPSVLTAAEISSAKAGETSAYDAIQRLRPQTTRPNGTA